MKTSRRDAFKFAGGAMAGVLFTPAPWRLITDTALWSENWPGVPRPLRGEIRTKLTTCALCPANCAVRARCVGDQPVSLAGVDGGLCPFGLTAHHLPYHPARLTRGPVEEALAAVAARKDQPIAILDLDPGRKASAAYRRAMRAANGLYIAPPRDLPIDLTAAKTVVSVGVPLLDGWGTPSKVFAARPNFRLIQIDAMQSRTAMLADEWIPAAPGAEFAALAQLNLPADGSTVVLGDAPDTAAINQRLGAYGRIITPRPEPPLPDASPVTSLDVVADHAIGVLLIDECSPLNYIPWHRIQQKLVRDNPLVITFTAFPGGYSRHAKYALPIAIYPEINELSAPLLSPPKGVTSLSDFLARVEPAARPVPPMLPAAPPSAQQESASDLPLLAIATPPTPYASPLMTKLYQESNLRLAPNRIALNPAGAAAARVKENSHATLQTRLGKCAVEVTIDPAVPPGAVCVGASPGIRDICGHAARAKVVKS